MRHPSKSSITLRATLIGIILIPFNSYWVLNLSYIWDSNRPTSLALLFNVLFTLLVLIGVGAILRRLRPALAFTQSELLTIYAMLCQASVFAGRDMLQVLVPLMGNGFWYATTENEWAQLFHQHLPEWLVVGKQEVLRGFYEGESTLYLQAHIHAWLLPTLIWVGFCLVIGVTMLCLNVLLRKQWQEHERLTYPIAQLPYEITRAALNAGNLRTTPNLFFNRRMMAVGLGIAAVLNLLYSLHQIDPVFPTIPLYHGFRLAEKPWSAMNNPGFRISFFPFAIGVGFLIPLDLGFSCWFFHLFWHFQRIIGESFGWRGAIGFPKEMAQIRGVWIALFLWTLWMGRAHVKVVLQTVFSRHAPTANDEGEALRYRTAAIAVIIGFILILAFCIKAGMSVWFAVLFFALYFAMSVTITRIRAELGPPAHDLYNAGPDLLLTDALRHTAHRQSQSFGDVALFLVKPSLLPRTPNATSTGRVETRASNPFQSVPTALGISDRYFRRGTLCSVGASTSLLPSRLRASAFVVCARRFQQACGVALQSQRDEYQRYALYYWWVCLCRQSLALAMAVHSVAPASCWICRFKLVDLYWIVVSDLNQLDNQTSSAFNGWCSLIPTFDPIFHRFGYR